MRKRKVSDAMRRSDREISDKKKIDEIIEACYCCRLGFNDGGQVYIVPLSFGFEALDGKRIFYFHGASEGRKIRLIRSEGRAGFELDTGYKLNRADYACGYSAAFQSVIGTGRITLIESAEEREHALRRIMLHNTSREDWSFPEAASKALALFKLEVEELACKEHE